ncbi:MAG: hypothetical protein ACD_43C00212G0008 [uncultured bacterium]|nr:MAG: hypothetical protein ACD_43C00212G0008 [uncultured bacterium]
MALSAIILLIPISLQAKVLNSSFEDGSAHWKCDGIDCPLFIVEYDQFAVSGTHYVALFGDTTMYQDVTLSQTADRLGILFHYWINGAYDSSLKLKISNKQTGEVYLKKNITETFVSEMNTQSFLLPAAALGQKVRVEFIVEKGEVYLDAISIERTLAYPAMRAYIVSWAGQNDLAGARVTVYDADNNQLRLKNLKTGVTGKSIVTNEAGATPLFRIKGIRGNKEAFSLCAKKGSIYKCTDIEPPMAGEDYSINFSPDYVE